MVIWIILLIITIVAIGVYKQQNTHRIQEDTKESFIQPTSTCSRYDCKPGHLLDIEPGMEIQYNTKSNTADVSVAYGKCYTCPSGYTRTPFFPCERQKALKNTTTCSVASNFACYKPAQDCAGSFSNTPHWDPTAKCINALDHSCGRCVNDSINLGCSSGYAREIGTNYDNSKACSKLADCPSGYEVTSDIGITKTCTQTCGSGYSNFGIGECLQSSCKSGYSPSILTKECIYDGTDHLASQSRNDCATFYHWDPTTQYCYTCGGKPPNRTTYDLWNHIVTPVNPPWSKVACQHKNNLLYFLPADDWYSNPLRHACNSGDYDMVDVAGIKWCKPKTYVRQSYTKNTYFVDKDYSPATVINNPADEKFAASAITPYNVPRHEKVIGYDPATEQPKEVGTADPAGMTTEPEPDSSELSDMYKCPPNSSLYAVSAGGFCCTGNLMAGGIITTDPSKASSCDGTVCAKDPNRTGGNPVCEIITPPALTCPSGSTLYGITAGGFCRSPDGSVCALDPDRTQGNTLCQIETAPTTTLTCPSGYTLYGITAGGFCKSSYDGSVCALDPNRTQGNTLCSTAPTTAPSIPIEYSVGDPSLIDIDLGSLTPSDTTTTTTTTTTTPVVAPDFEIDLGSLDLSGMDFSGLNF